MFTQNSHNERSLSFFLVEIIHILCTRQLRFYYVSVRLVTCNRNIFPSFPPISLKLFLLDTEQSMGKFRVSFCNLPPPPPAPIAKIN